MRRPPTSAAGLPEKAIPAWSGLLAFPACEVAPHLIGWRLVIGGVTARIAETEAYHSEQDRACHASRGRTPRASGLYAPPGTLYVYLCYGMHWMLNLVCDREGFPSAVLIRGIVIDGIDPRLSNGPGKVAKRLGLGRAHHGQHLDDGALCLLPPEAPPPRLRNGPRVGVDYAGPFWSRRRWRWWADGFPVAPA